MDDERTTLSDDEIKSGLGGTYAQVADADQDDPDADSTDSDADDSDADDEPTPTPTTATARGPWWNVARRRSAMLVPRLGRREHR